MTSPVSPSMQMDWVSQLLIAIHEGRNRQVRRMLDAIGHKTLRLCRISIGDIGLDGLKPGEKRLLGEKEIKSFYE